MLSEQVILRIWYVTCKWPVRRPGRRTLKQNWCLPSPKPTAWLILKNSSRDPITPKYSRYVLLNLGISKYSNAYSVYRLVSVVTMRRCTKRPSYCLIISPTLPGWHQLLCISVSSRLQWTLPGKLTPPAPGKRLERILYLVFRVL